MATTPDTDLIVPPATHTRSGGVVEQPERMLLRWDFQKLTRSGASTHVNILKPYLQHLRWLPGQTVIVELYSDETIRIRKPRAEDFGPQIGKARRGDMPVPVRP